MFSEFDAAVTDIESGITPTIRTAITAKQVI
jgi:hypothetical protein